MDRQQDARGSEEHSGLRTKIDHMTVALRRGIKPPTPVAKARSPVMCS